MPGSDPSVASMGPAMQPVGGTSPGPAENTAMQLDDKVALVTGAASGFGEGIARRYAAEAPAWSSPI